MRKNPRVGPKQPTLFGEELEPFIDLDDLDAEEVKKLPFRAFSVEEWEELPASWQVHIFLNDPKTKEITRLCFEEGGSCDDFDWDELPDEIQEHIYEHDSRSRFRVKRLAQALADATPSSEPEDILEASESQIDHYMSDDEWLWDTFGEGLMDRLEELYPNADLDEDDVKKAAEYGFNQANFEFSVTVGSGNFSAEQPGYWIDRNTIDHYFRVHMSPPGPLVIPDDMPMDEIERAVELAGELNDEFSDHGVDAKDVYEVIYPNNRWWNEIQHDSDYDSWGIDVDPNWDEIISDVVEHLDFEERVHYEEHPPEERILFRRQIGSPEDHVHTQRVDFQLGDTYYALDLVPSELKKETKRGRNCVGREENGYPQALRAGNIRLLSIRPESTENQWKRTYLMELVLDRPDRTSSLEEIVERGGISHVEQIKGYNNRVPGFDRGLYETGDGKPEFSSPAEAEALLEVVEWLNVKNPEQGEDIRRYIIPALRAGWPVKKNPEEDRPYGFNTPTMHWP